MKKTGFLIFVVLLISGCGIGQNNLNNRQQKNNDQQNQNSSINQTPEQSLYVSQKGGFSVSYGNEFKPFPNYQEIKINSESGGLFKENKLIDFFGLYLPKETFLQTNFSEAEIDFMVFDNTSCDIKQYFSGEMVKESKEILNEQQFAKLTTNGAAAGNYYQFDIYYLEKINKCYVIQKSVHDTQIANYDPNLGIKEYDKNKLNDLLSGVVQSFKIAE